MALLDRIHSGLAPLYQIRQLAKPDRLGRAALSTRRGASIFQSIFAEGTAVRHQPGGTQRNTDSPGDVMLTEPRHPEGAELSASATANTPFLIDRNESQVVVPSSIGRANPNAHRLSAVHACLSRE